MQNNIELQHSVRNPMLFVEYKFVTLTVGNAYEQISITHPLCMMTF